MELEDNTGLEDREESDSGDVLWDLHDEQEQTEAYQHICSASASLSFQKVLSSLPLALAQYFSCAVTIVLNYFILYTEVIEPCRNV